MEYLSIGINLIILFFVIKSNTVVKERLKTQDDLNNKMKSFMEIFKIEEVRRFVDMNKETSKMATELVIKEESKKFLKDSDKYLRNIIQKDVDGIKVDFENRYDEICNALADLFLELPIEDRPKFIEDKLKITGNDFIEELKSYNEWPNT
jgi:hypothetical protein